jgi:hypothetical protein
VVFASLYRSDAGVEVLRQAGLTVDLRSEV